LAKGSCSILFNISNIAADLLELFLKLLKASLGLCLAAFTCILRECANLLDILLCPLTRGVHKVLHLLHQQALGIVQVFPLHHISSAGFQISAHQKIFRGIFQIPM
jgi:hypothetical protein